MISPDRRWRPSTDRWLVSYADFVTLLFALFVVLFAVARTDRVNAKQLSESIKKAMRSRSTPPPPPRETELTSAFERLQQQLAPEIAAGKMKVALETRGVVISLRERAFFPSASDGIYPSAFDTMAKVAAVIRGLPNAIRLEGHTDSVPIQNSHFRSNWDLSAARSIAVLSWFESKCALPGERFAISGFADNVPVADNQSEEGRAQNRRVDVVIVSSAR